MSNILRLLSRATVTEMVKRIRAIGIWATCRCDCPCQEGVSSIQVAGAGFIPC